MKGAIWNPSNVDGPPMRATSPREDWGRTIKGSELPVGGSSILVQPPLIDDGNDVDPVWLLTYSVRSTGTQGVKPACSLNVYEYQGNTIDGFFRRYRFRPYTQRRIFVGRRVAAYVQSNPGGANVVDPNAQLDVMWTRLVGATPTVDDPVNTWNVYNSASAGAPFQAFGNVRGDIVEIRGGGIVTNTTTTAAIPAWLCLFDESTGVAPVTAPILSVPIGPYAPLTITGLSVDVWTGLTAAVSISPSAYVAPGAGYAYDAQFTIGEAVQTLTTGAV